MTTTGGGAANCRVLRLAAGAGSRFVVDLESGKPTLRLAHVRRVIGVLDGELQLQVPAIP